ncbi:hypothetical protein TWF730_004429 [Orbilia blumenaviensis]|uniref:DUF7029 domain-containing protein n=1 Tax=Orbilia blumenaviensis TaxID=1796055 RepID=A0AAV9TY36_9PEZI
MKLSSSLAATAVLGALSVSAAPAAKCTADNVLRHLRAAERSSSASVWCSTYTATPATTGQAYPTWLNAQYTASTSRLSSACTCLNSVASTTTRAPSSTITFGSYVPPTPAVTSTTQPWTVKQPLPTVKALPLAVETASVSDSIPPAVIKNAVLGSLGADNDTALVALQSFKAANDALLVNLDEFRSGLDGLPVCGADSITLKFTTAAYRDLAVSTWSNKDIILMTGGGEYCGTEGIYNYFKISAVAASDATGVALTVTKAEVEEVIDQIDTEFGTFNIHNHTEDTTINRKIRARGVSFNKIIVEIEKLLDKTIHRFTTPEQKFSFTGTNLFQINRDAMGDPNQGGSAALGCTECGIEGAVRLFGSVSLSPRSKQYFGAVVGIDIVNPVFNIDLWVGWTFHYEGSHEIPLLSVVPWYVDIENAITLTPNAQIIAATDIDVKSALQVKGVGFRGTWGTFHVGFNLLTKLPVIDGDLIPSIDFHEPIFFGGVSPWGIQDARITAWVGPRIGMDIELAFGIAKGHADVTIQFPAVNVEARLDSLDNCPGSKSNDMCVYLHADALMRGTAKADASIGGAFEAGVEHELFSYNIGVFLDKRFHIDVDRPW